jgi:hypothetical protein
MWLYRGALTLIRNRGKIERELIESMTYNSRSKLPSGNFEHNMSRRERPTLGGKQSATPSLMPEPLAAQRG